MDILTYAALEERNFEMQLAETGHERETTFYHDFSIAECYGIKSVEETYENALKDYGTNERMWRELTLSLNWKCWRWYEKDNELSKAYSDLFYKAREHGYDTFKDNELIDFYNYLD